MKLVIKIALGIVLGWAAITVIGTIAQEFWVQSKLIKTMSSLATEPAKRGKPLSEELAGYYSMRAIGQRYRVIYRIEDETITVVVVALGIRKQGDQKDAYQLAKKLVKQGLL